VKRDQENEITELMSVSTPTATTFIAEYSEQIASSIVWQKAVDGFRLKNAGCNTALTAATSRPMAYSA
jgi:hypothetical protein